MKLPNGYGSITKLSGRRRKPYLARVTLGWDIDPESGKAIQNRVSLGTFETKKEALQALTEYGRHPYDVKGGHITLQELYDRWTASYFPSLQNDSSMRAIKSAWSYCHFIHTMKVHDVRTRHLKGAINDGYIISKKTGETIPASPGVKQRMKSMFNLMFDYALEFEFIDRNYARAFDLSKDIIREKEDATRGHLIFSEDEMQKLWQLSVPFSDWILIQCYMGWRPQELATLRMENVHLEENYIVGGMKTRAGENRPVPIHHRIRPLVEKNFNVALSLGSEFLLNDPESCRGGIKITYDKYAHRYIKVIEALELKPGHRPHDPRKMFITMAKKAGVDEYCIKLIAGHKITDVTEAKYTERGIDWLQREIEKIP